MQEVDTRLGTARILMVAATNPSVTLTLRNLALASGLTEEQVQRVLNSDAYRSLIQDQIKLKVSGLLDRGLQDMATIMSNDKLRPGDRIAAFKAVVATYDAITRCMGKSEPPDATADFDNALRMLDGIRSPKKIGIRHESTRNPSDREDSNQEASD